MKLAVNSAALARLSLRSNSECSLPRLFAAISLVLMVLYAISGLACHQIRCVRLKQISYFAVRDGARLLPSSPEGAIQIARSSVEANSASDRYLTIVAVKADSSSLTLQIEEKLPLYLVFLTGEFASGDILVTARAKRSSRAVRFRI